MIKSDFHIHTDFSGDCEHNMESMINASIQKGLKHICITDHMDLDFPKEYGLNFEFDLEEYMTKIESLQFKYGSKIRIFKGIEIGLLPGTNYKYDAILSKYDWDFVIGSTHLVHGKDPYYGNFWDDHSEEEGYSAYIASASKNLEEYDNFDIYGHLDYIVRYGPTKNQNFQYETYREVIHKALQDLLEKGKGIELNTAGYKHGLNNPHPQKDILREYRKMGGELITIGSDAHSPEYIAYDFDKAGSLLLELGFRYHAYYEKRKPVYVKL